MAKTLYDILKSSKDQSTKTTKSGETKQVTPAIGDYDESAGGGTPMKKGQHIDKVAETAEEAQQYRKNNPDAVVRVKQPRDTDGQFTYNSANKRPLEYKSRGETIPPFLRGVKLTFAKKSKKGSIVDVEGHKFGLGDAVKSEEDFVNMFKEYKDEQFGEMGGLGNKLKGKGGKTGTTITIGALNSGFNEYKSRSLTGKKPDYVKKASPAKPSESKTNPVAEKPANDETGKMDTSLAKSDPEAFTRKYKKELRDIVSFANDNDIDLDVDGLVESIGNGDFKSFEDIKEALK